MCKDCVLGVAIACSICARFREFLGSESTSAIKDHGQNIMGQNLTDEDVVKNKTTLPLIAACRSTSPSLFIGGNNSHAPGGRN